MKVETLYVLTLQGFKCLKVEKNGYVKEMNYNLDTQYQKAWDLMHKHHMMDTDIENFFMYWEEIVGSDLSSELDYLEDFTPKQIMASVEKRFPVVGSNDDFHHSNCIKGLTQNGELILYGDLSLRNIILSIVYLECGAYHESLNDELKSLEGELV